MRLAPCVLTDVLRQPLQNQPVPIGITFVVHTRGIRRVYFVRGVSDKARSTLLDALVVLNTHAVPALEELGQARRTRYLLRARCNQTAVELGTRSRSIREHPDPVAGPEVFVVCEQCQETDEGA